MFSRLLGPVLGGLLVTTVGWQATIAVDAASFLVSALTVQRLALSTTRTGGAPHSAPSAAGGFVIIFADRLLRRLFVNALTLGGAVILLSSLLPVLVLHELGLRPWQYGLVLGVPCLFGLLGSLSAAKITARVGKRVVLLGFGALRGVALIPYAFVPAGPWAFPIVLGAECLLLLAAGVFNPCFAAVRLSRLSEDQVVPATTSWSAAGKIAQPATLAAGGLVAAGWGLRPALALAAGQGLLSLVPLPWSRRDLPDPDRAQPAGALPPA